MKRVFRNSQEVIHLFAQRTQDEAKCSNVYFYGDKIYSYGQHYLLGQFKEHPDKGVYILIEDRGCSSTTSKHIWQIRAATRQYQQFFMESITPIRVNNKLHILLMKLSKAKKPELYINEAKSLYAKFVEYWEFIGQTPELKEDIEAQMGVFNGANYNEYLQGVEERTRLRNEEIARKNAEIFKESLQRFYEYKQNYIYNSLEDFLRISQDSTHVETSQGVRIPIDKAKALYILIKAGRDKKGYDINGYTVISINGVLKVGCHNININSVKEVGEKIL